jgi:hypothetical protein
VVHAVVVVEGEVALKLAAQAAEARVEVASEGGPPALVEDRLVQRVGAENSKSVGRCSPTAGTSSGTLVSIAWSSRLRLRFAQICAADPVKRPFADRSSERVQLRGEVVLVDQAAE